ncbi:MAG: Fic family protein [Muribaculaceae bacterium]|nr:Fic family protein [Muribaculaceae bacterium]
MFFHERENWPNFHWDSDVINTLQLKAMHRLGYLAGRMASIGFDNQIIATVEAVTNDVVASSEIEGVRLNSDEVRSSVARNLGVHLEKNMDSSHYVEGIVEMMLDASRNFSTPLTEYRLFKWHCMLFPNASDMTVGAYRTDEMSVVSGSFGRERIHYRAPSPDRLPKEMETFLMWLNDESNVPGILKSAIAHLWFVSIHPFDDGNGRIGRAISDRVLAPLDNDDMHFYSFSRQILKDKRHFYKVLERTQRGIGDITEWLEWYFGAFIEAVEDSSSVLSRVLRKATFWNSHSQASISNRQRMVLNKYLDGYEAKLTAKNWEKITGVSKDTALRDIDSLVKQGILIPTPGRVRDIPYSIDITGKKATENESPFKDITIETEGLYHYITANYGSTSLRDRIGEIDHARLENREITLTDLAYKHFAYILD